MGEERYQWEAIQNLDHFFTRIYRYHREKGFVVILTSRVLNIMTLFFTITFTAVLLLKVDWTVLFSECHDLGLERECELADIGVFDRKFSHNSGLYNAMVIIYLILTSLYLVWNCLHFFLDYRELSDVRDFCNQKVGVSERELQTIRWPELVRRLVRLQETHRLCIHRDLSAFDIVARIMRKENYLIGMLNKGVLALYLPFPGMRRRCMLTKTLEWNLHWCVLEHMFDQNFMIRAEFRDVEALRRRFRTAGLVNLALSPFILMFMLSYFFLRNAEKFYRHPGTVGSRNWSPYARWKIREFNELPGDLNKRLDDSREAAEKYVTQFPSHLLTHVARFIAYIAGSFTATLLLVGVANEALLQRDMWGQNLVWWIAMFGVVLASSRAFIPENPPSFDPEYRMSEVVKWSHYMPRHWRGRCHTLSVQSEFQMLFQFKAVLFLEEVVSIFLTPFVLFYSMPHCAPRIVEFVEHFTVEIEGVGHICSLSAFDFQVHGNVKYGAPSQGNKAQRSCQGKMEKSFLSFATTYADWEPPEDGRRMLANLNQYSQTKLGGSGLLGRPPSEVAGALQGSAGPSGSLLGSEALRRGAEDEGVMAHMVESQQLLQRFYEDQMRLLKHGPGGAPPPGGPSPGPDDDGRQPSQPTGNGAGGGGATEDALARAPGGGRGPGPPPPPPGDLERAENGAA